MLRLGLKTKTPELKQSGQPASVENVFNHVQEKQKTDIPGAAENSSLSKSSSQFLRTRVSASRKTAFEYWVSFQQLT